ncbi:hypothetical protein [Microbacterium sp. nov. GSS16]
MIPVLNDERAKDRIRGVISAGSNNLGGPLSLAGDIISRKCSGLLHE